MSENPIREAIQEAISDHEVILFMKGTPERPMCGFSARTVAALDALGREYAAVDVLPDPRIRQELSAISNWPTIPQLFVKGELVGGCDIVTEMYESGELAQTLGVETPAEAPAQAPVAAEPGAPPLMPENRLGSDRGSARGVQPESRARPGRARALPGAAVPLPESPGSCPLGDAAPTPSRCVCRRGPGRARSADPPGAMGWAWVSVPPATAVRAAASIRGASSVAILQVWQKCSPSDIC